MQNLVVINFSEDDAEFLKLLLSSISSTHYALFKSAIKLLMTIFNQRRRLFHAFEKVMGTLIPLLTWAWNSWNDFLIVITFSADANSFQ